MRCEKLLRAFRLRKEVGIVTDFADWFVQGLAGVLRRASLPRRLHSEIDLGRVHVASG